MSKSTSTVNLDGLIRRQDLSALMNNSAASSFGTGDIPLTELAKGRLYYELLRKPHFQRETDDWSIDNVVTLIKSYRDAKLIPSVILWRNEQGYMFVIDGAHRLSALIAWVNDDYGDKAISMSYFKEGISDRQRKLAEECRARVASEVGDYSSLSQILTSPNPSEEKIKWASNLTKPISTQWVFGDANVAAESFLIINQRSVQIDETEKYMIQYRNAPSVMAARAIISSGTGYQYWGKYDPEIIKKIEERAKKINQSMFGNGAITKGDGNSLSIAGDPNNPSGMRMVVEFVNLINQIKDKDDKNDPNGELTLRCLDKIWGITKYISSDEPASLDLHPAVYFWGMTGNHQPSLFLAVVDFVKDLISKNELIRFTKSRKLFENFLSGNSMVVKELLGRHGGWKKSLKPVRTMLDLLFDGIKSGKDLQEIEKEIVEKLNLKTADAGDSADWRTTKAAAKRLALLESSHECPICKARLQIADASYDHIDRVQDGGINSVLNTQLTHHYCNHGYKEYLNSLKSEIPDLVK